MEQRQYGSKVRVCLDREMGESLSFSSMLCVQQQTKSVEPHSTIRENGNGSADTDPNFQFHSSYKNQLIKPVSYNNLSILLPHCESSSRRVTRPNMSSGGAGKRDLKDSNRGEVVLKKKKKSVFKSIFKPCRICHAVEPSAIRDQNPLAARKQSSF